MSFRHAEESLTKGSIMWETLTAKAATLETLIAVYSAIDPIRTQELQIELNEVNSRILGLLVGAV